jgi:hypothetical protein
VAGAWDDDDDSLVGAWVWLCCFETKLFLIFCFKKFSPTFSSRNYLMSNHSDKYDIWKCIWKCKGKKKMVWVNSQAWFLIISKERTVIDWWVLPLQSILWLVGFLARSVCVCVCVCVCVSSSWLFIPQNFEAQLSCWGPGKYISWAQIVCVCVCV